ncbi:DUF962 domain-containing protein [Mucilaginibacter limnophilus]|uniref:DUF962 domain-containing protein n=1 Tax=Mucilaginibacter limnophilus TaxID=1932778 RepID=A0A3S2V0W8_9SPHI|nr:Mpo1-like protein [Mucilaginibacter limnophilus]RVU00216.1 DUF962 domain-containing protein [Mucilaginibacter limnophilus]
MAKQKQPVKSQATVTPQREVDKLFAQYEAANTHPVNKIFQYIFVPLFSFGLFALVWSLPFPHINFLGKYNGYINWASFLLAIVIYLYYRLSPVLSYFILFTLFGFSYLIIKLEQLQKAGGPALWQVSLIVFIVGLLGYFAATMSEENKASLTQKLKNLFIAPLYFWHLLWRKVSVKY